MNENILNTGVQNFIAENLNTDILSVSLGKTLFEGVAPKELAQQLAGHQKFRKKVPSWYGTKGLYFPTTLPLEQSSSEATASYKRDLATGGVLLDLTGGFGVDAFFLSAGFNTVHYCERDPDLARIAAHNFKVLGAGNIQVHSKDSFEVLSELRQKGTSLDWIYADPARRDTKGQKRIQLQDYQPNIPAQLPELLQATENVLLKTSPLLDLTAGLRALQEVAAIHIVAVSGEVRELLWHIRRGHQQAPLMTAVDLGREETLPFSFEMEEARRAQATFALPGRYLYEPNAAIMKSGAFALVSERYGLDKLHEHSHLYTSDHIIPFPGRRFEIIDTLPFKPRRLAIQKANITTRNFPQSVAAIRRRTGIRPGGSQFLFFTTLLDGSLRVLVTRKV